LGERGKVEVIELIVTGRLTAPTVASSVGVFSKAAVDLRELQCSDLKSHHGLGVKHIVIAFWLLGRRFELLLS
jgi:hypothetical protein